MKKENKEELEERTCRYCNEYFYTPTMNGSSDYCLKKEEWINPKKPCRDYVDIFEVNNK